VGTSRPWGSVIASLLDELCTEQGLCLSDEEAARLIASPPPSVDSFTDAVFAAEGLDPAFHGHLRHRVRVCVVRWFERLPASG
jgi:hypothetical protein